jgi:CheY-like chemotaxis protein
MTIFNDRLSTSEQRVAELEAAIARRDEFITQIAHELRTPLAAVVGWADLLRAMPPKRERIEHAAIAIERATLVQVRLLDDLVSGVKLAVGALTLDREPVRLANTIADAVDSVRPLALENRVAIDADSEEGGTVFGDAVRLQQALTNVVVAALRVTPLEGRIELAVERDDVHVEIRVYCSQHEDVMSEHDRLQRESVLETDLGLKIATQLVELHGGRCQVTASGEVCSFTIVLPLLPVSFEPTTTSNGSKTLTECTGLRVLVVDDEPEARSIVAEVLTHHGAAVDVAGNAGAALTALASKKYDVLVTDIAMPLDDGFTLLDRIRQTEGSNKTIPAIALTAHASPEVRDRTVAAGFAAYVTKPVSPIALVNVVATVARSPAATEPT